MKQIVVISHDEDAHLAYVKPYLRSKMTVVDPYAIIDGYELSYSFDGRRSHVMYKNEVLDDVKSVWYRKPGDAIPKDITIDDNFRTYAESCIQDHAQMLRAEFTNARWISDFYAINRARNKSAQLGMAAALGFRVPKTLMTSDPARAKQFMLEHSPVIIKSQRSSIPSLDSTVRFFFAKRIDAPEKVNLHNLHLAPAIFQQAIDAVADIRVTIAGDSVFAAIIRGADDKDDGSVRDWRNWHNRHALFESYDADLPEAIRQKCLMLTKKMGLLYGAIDLVLDNKGALWFIEINPNGQWAFVEEDTKQPIGKAIARLLES